MLDENLHPQADEYQATSNIELAAQHGPKAMAGEQTQHRQYCRDYTRPGYRLTTPTTTPHTSNSAPSLNTMG